MLKDIDNLKGKHQPCEKCDLYSDLLQIQSGTNNTNSIICHLDDDMKDMLFEKLKSKSISEIIEIGLLFDGEDT